jgi:hypothetical protein
MSRSAREITSAEQLIDGEHIGGSGERTGLYGAQGGASVVDDAPGAAPGTEPGGLGAGVTASLQVSPGTVFQVNAGPGGNAEHLRQQYRRPGVGD